MANHSSVTKFILLGLTNDINLQAVLFLFLILTYILSVMGNSAIILLTLLDHRLQTPMYFFLRNFAFLEISFTSVFVPKMLINIGTGDKTISFAGCFTQYFFAILLGATEFYLLAVMSYDRYVAICRPLHYTTIMSRRLCFQLVLSSWLSGFIVVAVPHAMTLQLPFCASNIINHYCCDYTILLHLSCSDTHFIEVIQFLLAAVTLILTLLLVILSYTHIIKTILRIPSAQQRKKAFSTCSSHMIVVSLSYGSCIFMYINPSFKDAANFNKRVAVLNTSVAPLLNPFIYTLRNKQVKIAFKDMLSKTISFFKK
ncbi:olfactory receptor family 6 subfamily C member 33 [Mus musculus]|jgi:olfactory receptor|uniref:Olfactory receptor n=1 Tax=Mus musculus TaxID=10090 RepID=Q8VFU5_MOUSE|nr:olfactory receptor family 6 subfamily C member 33 [Mus musculus]AAI19399.1 Olfactory receptor 820 [Mus musculus]AAI19401.1 Olfactory receptor 820 [Mus musculus]AAL61083.1 olfactory receptor MOR116-1 [Mus musculus]AAP71307.1 olfactory receptor Olfr820 [Mus musculus]EDL24686.1 olfactory receptor 820 [Mus musculus]|eukprot:NP_666886.1 olfactory receptor 820 [Mus musculus]